MWMPPNCSTPSAPNFQKGCLDTLDQTQPWVLLVSFQQVAFVKQLMQISDGWHDYIDNDYIES